MCSQIMIEQQKIKSKTDTWNEIKHKYNQKTSKRTQINYVEKTYYNPCGYGKSRV